jgi:hypothetical protein
MSDPCLEYVPLLVRAADGDGLDAAHDERLADHLASCARCREALAAQRAVREVLVSRPPAAASPALRVRIAQAIEREWFWLAGVDLRRWTWRAAPVAGALLLAVVFGGAEPAAPETPAADATPVSAALYSANVSDASLLSLMLRADADDPLADYIKDTSR